MSNLPHKDFYYSKSLYNDMNAGSYEGFDNYKSKHYQTYENFDSQPEDVFTLFYSPRCSSCTRIKPVIQQTLGGIATEYVDYRVGNYSRYGNNAVMMVDVDRYPDVVRQFNIESFPTFKLLRGVTDRIALNATSVIDYTGPPAVREIDTFIQGGVQSGVAVREFLNSRPEDVFTLFYSPRYSDCTRIKPIIQQTLGGIATEYVDYRVGNYRRYGNNAVVMVDVDRYPDVIQRFNIQRFPTLKLLRGVTDRVALNATAIVDYTGPPVVREMDTFLRGGVGVTNVVNNMDVQTVVNDVSVPNVVNNIGITEFFNSRPEDVFTVFYQPNSLYYNNISPVISQTLGGIATEYVDYRVGNYRRYNNNAVVAINVNQYPELVSRFNIQSFPAFKLLRGVTDRVNLNAVTVVDYTGPTVVNEIDTFIRGGYGVANVGVPVVGVPNVGGPVVGVPNVVSNVGVTEFFDSQPEDVFTLFYSPRCSNCTQVKPVIQQTLGGIATEYIDYRVGNYRRYGNNAVVMVDVDRYPDMVRQFNVQSFPTLKLLRGVTDRVSLNASSVVDYTGPPVVSEIDTFVRGGGIRSNVVDPRLLDPSVVDPRVVDPRVVDPRVVDPRLLDTSMVDPRMVDPRLLDTSMVDPRMVDTRVVDTRVVDPRMVDTRVVDPRMVDPRVVDPRVVDPGALDPRVLGPNVVGPGGFGPNVVGPSVGVTEYFDSQPEDVFTLFYTPKCRYCTDVLPFVQQTLGGIAVDYGDYRVGNYRRYGNRAVVMVNVDRYPQFIQRYDIRSFPTFKLLRGVTDRVALDSTTVVDYTGGRTVQEFDTFIRG